MRCRAERIGELGAQRNAEVHHQVTETLLLAMIIVRHELDPSRLSQLVVRLHRRPGTPLVFPRLPPPSIPGEVDIRRVLIVRAHPHSGACELAARAHALASLQGSWAMNASKTPVCFVLPNVPSPHASQSH